MSVNLRIEGNNTDISVFLKEFSKYFDFKTNDKYYQNKRGLGYRQYLNSVKEKSNNACSLIIQELVL